MIVLSDKSHQKEYFILLKIHLLQCSLQLAVTAWFEAGKSGREYFWQHLLI
jgi:hypothetical protein